MTNINNNQYLPTFKGLYISPNLRGEDRAAFIENRIRQLDKALIYLSEFNRPMILKKRCCPLPICDNSVWNLGLYFGSRPLAIVTRAFLCCFVSEDDAKTPLPREAAETLRTTTTQFERNTCGVCCIAPAVVIGTPWVVANALVTKLLTIVSGLVITTTAGTDTYVFSGNSEVVPDGQGDLIVQGGIRVDAIAAIKSAYIQLTEHLKNEWDNGDIEKRVYLYKLCTKINDVWEDIFNAILLSGIKNSSVEDILGPFSLLIYDIVVNRAPDQRKMSLSIIDSDDDSCISRDKSL